MSELRWTLLILGVVFIAALSWWERRRPRQAFAPRLRDPGPGHAAEPRLDRHERAAASGAPLEASAERPEPWIGDAEISDAVLSDVALNDAADAPERAAEHLARSHSASGVPDPLQELPTLIIPDRDEQVALQAAWDEAPPEPTLIDPAASEAAEAAEPSEPAEPARARPAQPAPAREMDSRIPGAEGVGAVRIVAAEPDPAAAAIAEPIVEWPPEESRRILALRLVASPPERFPGRSLRLALAAEGFLLGKFAIFHKPDESNRAVLSAASLTRPGAFDLETMDSQRYAGLSLFAVLPGPRLPPQAFEELLAAARNLNERLQGALQDERGGPLTPLRVASIRESLRAQAADPSAAAAHES